MPGKRSPGNNALPDRAKHATTKKVLVIGGGPAGMEAARVAALRGHEVMLVEKQHRLGGALPVAALVKGLEIENLPSLMAYLERTDQKIGCQDQNRRRVQPVYH